MPIFSGSMKDVVSGITNDIKRSSDAMDAATNATVSSIGLRHSPNTKLSVVSKASNAMMDFPLLISTSVSPNSSRIVAKLIELLYASFVESAITMQSAIDLSKDGSVKTLIDKVHNNITLRESSELQYSLLEEEIRDMTFMATEDSYVEIPEYIPNDTRRSFNEDTKSQIDLTSANKAYDDYLKSKSSISKTGNFTSKGQYRASDIDKAISSLQPLTFQGELTAYTGQGGDIATIKFNYSLRVVPHPIENVEIVQTLKDVIVTRSGKFKWLQVLTGEKNLIRDLIFGIDDIKKDLVPDSGGSNWWRTLRRLARLQKNVDGYLKESKIPTGSLLVSQADLDEISYLTGNGFNDKTLEMICDHFTLMGMYIIDESIGSLKIFLADRPKAETYSIDNLISLTKKSKAVSASDLARLGMYNN